MDCNSSEVYLKFFLLLSLKCIKGLSEGWAIASYLFVIISRITAPTKNKNGPAIRINIVM